MSFATSTSPCISVQAAWLLDCASVWPRMSSRQCRLSFVRLCDQGSRKRPLRPRDCLAFLSDFSALSCCSLSLFRLSRPVSHIPQGAALTVNTNPNVNIKSEPVSPNRDRSTPCSTSGGSGGAGGGGQVQVQGQGLVTLAYPGSLRLEVGGQGRSPVDSLSSNGSSYEGSDRDDGGGAQGRGADFHHQAGAVAQQPAMVLLRPSSAEPPEQDGASVKRVRLDTWLT